MEDGILTPQYSDSSSAANSQVIESTGHPNLQQQVRTSNIDDEMDYLSLSLRSCLYVHQHPGRAADDQESGLFSLEF